jgi:hypothetical protein
MSHTTLAWKPDMSLADIGFSGKRGELIAKEDNYSLEK